MRVALNLNLSYGTSYVAYMEAYQATCTGKLERESSRAHESLITVIEEKVSTLLANTFAIARRTRVVRNAAARQKGRWKKKRRKVQVDSRLEAIEREL